MADLAKQLVLAAIASATSLVAVFAVTFIGVKYWAAYNSSDDDTATVSAFLLGLVVALPASAGTFAIIWSRQRGRN